MPTASTRFDPVVKTSPWCLGLFGGLVCGSVLTAAAVEKACFDVRDYGAVGDGKQLDTEAIQRAIDNCGKGGGGTVYFPPGTYRAASLRLRSNVTLHLPAQATLLQSNDMADYPMAPEMCYVYCTESRRIFLRGDRVTNVSVVGVGVIDGQRALDEFEDRYDGHRRRGPLPILFENSHDIVLKDVTVRNSPGWSVTFFGCRNVGLERVKSIKSYADGINLVYCQNVRLNECLIEGSRDDAITTKNEPVRAMRYGGVNEDGPGCGFLTENIAIENTTVCGTSHPAIKIGTGTADIFGTLS